MKNQLFNQTLLKKYSKNFKLNPSKHDLLKDYISKVEDGHFKSETKNYLYFYDVILKGVLDYKKEDVLFDEGVDVGTGRSEFVLKSNEKKFMVIELKGQGIDLDKRQSGRSDNKNPVEQAFGYAINTGDVDWIMVSNYEEFRLYNYYEKTKFISFNIDELLDKKKFAYFMLSFSRKSHIESDYITKVREDTLVVDRKLASEFYKLYNETRLMLIKELESESQMERLDAIHYAQLILNRYMFICFAEDTGLLPSQISVDTISTPILKGNIRHRSIWQRLNELCLDINEGNEFKKINEYNGGLFSEDLDFIKIRDIVEDQTIFKNVYQEWNFTEYEKDISHLLGKAGHLINPIYRNMLTISSFDFSTELDVNILGHIFENSIGDIEELKEDTKGRRKKEGIFYTPDYITDYICKNTIIPYLSKSGDVNTVDELLKEYWGSKIEELDQKVKEIKIVDPACGSGAFLNKASDVLLEIHQKIHETRYKDKKDTLIPYFDSIEERREILLNNIYGVDLNMESVEITKLSLFLKVCRKGLKLPNLDKNIKCGNSLIDDSKYTDKPFNWENEFSGIFKDGGFDVVIGNPPYVEHKKLKEFNTFFKEEYKSYVGTADLYVYFFEVGLNILKESGILSFISSNKFIKTSYGKNLRGLLSFYQIKEIIDFTELKVFDVLVASCILIISKKPKANKILVSFVEDSLKEYETLQRFVEENNFSINSNNLDSNIWQLESEEKLNVKNKIEFESNRLVDYESVKIFRGITTGCNEAFVVDSKTRNELVNKDKENIEVIKPLAQGRDIKRWRIDYKNMYLIFTRRGISVNNYPSVKNYLKQFKEILTPRNHGEKIGRKPGDYQWYEIQDSTKYYPEFEKEKIIWGLTADKWAFAYDDTGYYLPSNGYILTSSVISIKYLLSLINSKLMMFYFDFIGIMTAGGAYTLKQETVREFPIKEISDSLQKPFIHKVESILQLNYNFQEEVNGFKHWIQKEFNVEKLSQKLEKYYELSEDEFIDEMRKKKVDTKSRKNREYLEHEFSESLAIITPLLQEIERTDNEIDQMVYELYGLNDEEIQIIEKSLEK